MLKYKESKKWQRSRCYNWAKKKGASHTLLKLFQA